MLKPLAVALVLSASAAPALASSGDAWAEFAAAVEASCLEATSAILTNATAIVDPFGSESFGLALVTGEAAPGVTKSIICVFDKQAETVEIGGELDVPAAAAP